MTKQLNNEQMLKALLQDLTPMEISLLRERIVLICDITTKSIKDTPKAWDNGFINSDLYTALIAKVQKHIGFDKPKHFVVAQRETGQLLEFYKTHSEALDCLNKYEKQDKLDNIFEDNFYEILEKNEELFTVKK